MASMPPIVEQFIVGVLKDLGITPDATNVEGFGIWLENEQGVNWTAFEQNKGNPLGIQTAAAQASGRKGDMATGISLTAAELKKSAYAGIVSALRNSVSTTDIAQAIMASPWSGYNTSTQQNGYTQRGLQGFLNPGSSGGASGSLGQVEIPTTKNAAPIAGANLENFHGYNIAEFKNSAILGDIEESLQKYATDAAYRAQVDQALSTKYGYQSNWWKNIPEVNAIMVYAALNLDPATAASKNEFLGLLSDTQWWKTTNANQRAWDQAYGTDGAPGSDVAQAHQALENAQEIVLADANQIGVTLTKSQLQQLALMYASNSYVQSGSFGSQSGTVHEWLDQAIIDTAMNISGQTAGGHPTDFGNAPGAPSDWATQTGYLTAAGAPKTGTTPGTGPATPQNPAGLFGIASQLYDVAQQIAQQYLMYNPTSGGGLINNSFLLQQVQNALEHYTGSGSSFGSSNLINGFTAQFTELMKNMASQYYPSLAGSIAQGVTPQAYVQPYTQLISGMTGINPDSIDYTSPQWSWVIGTPDPKTGVKTALTPDQVQRKIVTMPVWQNSNNAQVLGSDVATTLNREFGFGGA